MFDRILSVAKNATVTAVSATVTAVGAVSSLVGNPLTKDFEVGKQVASFGPILAWRIYEGRKRTNGHIRNERSSVERLLGLQLRLSSYQFQRH